jgi:hypothetical protein
MMKKKQMPQSCQTDVSRSWWNFKSEDDQIWLMMKYGYDTPFDPKRVKVAEMVKMYEAEQRS